MSPPTSVGRHLDVESIRGEGVKQGLSGHEAASRGARGGGHFGGPDHRPIEGAFCGLREDVPTPRLFLPGATAANLRLHGVAAVVLGQAFGVPALVYNAAQQ